MEPTQIQVWLDQGEDVHTERAALVFGVKPAEVTAEQRKYGKSLNYMELYGASRKLIEVV